MDQMKKFWKGEDPILVLLTLGISKTRSSPKGKRLSAALKNNSKRDDSNTIHEMKSTILSQTTTACRHSNFSLQNGIKVRAPTSKSYIFIKT
jgi:hypothetical protein